ncbi:UDP-N-acetylmuramoyl-tripeptide--D-alanyl-D-alanine ligase [Geojedonia litorea]|uniref:UDP-N-acetylmuramoyl-tripeptide--D-alanyl-D-alanine ligase n=1 Tax=Geojedonia litorea TaxID=1268269 RepID=A0ABV9MZA3_9FLAO
MTIQALYTLFQECPSISTDTRKITPNSMFFALKGDNFNGNSFAKTALESGAKYCVIDEKEFLINEKCILVDDVLKTLQELANYHRKQLKTPIIALTGSNGKTTTKELIHAVLSTQFKTLATKGNLNNHIGVPLTLLSLTRDVEIGIIEMGANHHKEIEFLCQIALPDYGLITNFGKAHLEGFGSIEGVIKAKSELYEHLKQHHKPIFLNINDPVQVKQAANYNKLVTFDTSDSNHTLKLKSAQPLLSFEYQNTTVKTHLTGAYNFNNICAAIAIGTYFKVRPEFIKQAIKNYIPTNNRSQVIKKGTNTIILDAYNANPTSMMAALENFKQTESNQKVLFLGDMFELGADSAIEHQNIVNYIEKHIIANVNLIGSNFFKTKTVNPLIKTFETFEDLRSDLNSNTVNNALILIKGSRGMALERVLEFL